MIKDKGTATVLTNGNLEIACQLTETVPVAQYANVILGPVGLRWQIANPGIEALGTVNWDEMESLTAEQQTIYDEVRGWLRATSKLCEHQISEDREIVEESVRLMNQREAEEAEAAAKKAKPKRASSRRR
ncbi:MAG TPA: hypothetical protein VNS88_15765 [Nitrospiraceae bacterium]|nr:hypothetical protein [Nitrospiraceae bacterium]